MIRTQPYRIVICDDHKILRAGLKNLIGEVDDLQVVGEANNGRELLDLLDKHPPDLLILDLSMPEMTGLSALEEIRRKLPGLKVLVLTMHKEREYLRKAMKLGIDGYILKDDVFEKLILAIRDIQQGRKAISNDLISSFMEEYHVIREGEASLELLTRREREVLRFIAEGLTNREAAEKMDISVRTVEAHRARIMEKLQINSVAGLVKYAMERGLV
ncbi:MAG: response regulator transcription factor [Leptospirales bacterium]|nr:response regulator transcription factor [Leptospirales bacterium]